jgi:hypothetical protein
MNPIPEKVLVECQAIFAIKGLNFDQRIGQFGIMEK